VPLTAVSGATPGFLRPTLGLGDERSTDSLLYDFAEYDSPERLAKAECAFACLVKPCNLQQLESVTSDAFDHAADHWLCGQEFGAQIERRFSVSVGV
jgi:hypothetical protein